MKRSLIALLMSLLMLMSLLPVEAMAAELGEVSDNPEEFFETVIEPEQEAPAEPAVEPVFVEAPAAEEPVIEEPVIEEPVIEEPAVEEPVTEEPVIEAPVVEEPAIEEPLPADETGENEASDTEETPCVVVFRCDPETAEITVYSRQELERAAQEQTEPKPIAPEYGINYLLWAGEYVYCATAEGYAAVEKQPFVVADEETEKTVYVTLTALETEAPETEAPMELADKNTENNSILTEAETEEISLEPVAAAADGIVIDEINFPDPSFRSYVAENCDKDHSGFLSEAEIAQVYTISVAFRSPAIKDLTGIEHFTALNSLQCSNNQLTILDLSGNKELEKVWCDNNQLMALDVSGCTKLKVLSFNTNQLMSIDVSHCTALTEMKCHENQLTNLDVSSNTALTILWCSYNRLTTLDVRANTRLTNLECGKNQLASLDVSRCTSLTELRCYINQLTELNVSSNAALTELFCSNNQLTVLDVSNCTALEFLYCYDNQLTGLEVNGNPALRILTCDNNKLITLDVSHCAALTELHCDGNQLTSLDVHANTALTDLSCAGNQLTSLDVRENTELVGLGCGSNQLTSLDTSENTALMTLSCNDNQLTSLDVKANAALDLLQCSVNQLTSLDVSKNTALRILFCSRNHLTSLDVSANTALTMIGCSNQSASVELPRTEGTQLDFADLVGAGNVDRVSVTAVSPEDVNYTVENGVLTAEAELTGLTYNYGYGGPLNGTMDVTLTFDAATEPEKPEIYYDSMVIHLDKPIEDIVFSTPSTTYNPELAFYLCALSGAAYNQSEAYDSLQSLGFDEVTQTYTKDIYPDYSIGKKELEDGRTLVAIVVRGSDNPNENPEQWIKTNGNLGFSTFYGGGVHQGFAEAATLVMDSLKDFMGGGFPSDVTYFVTGHSLGAATANLVSYALAYLGVPQDNIYDYNFACPDVVKKSDTFEHTNMFNIGDARDPVSFVPGNLGNTLSGNFISRWNKFGQSRWFSYDWSNWNYLKLDIGAHDLMNYLTFLGRGQAWSFYETYLDVVGSRYLSMPGSLLDNMFSFVVRCPVDVAVYDSKGNAIAGVTGGEPNYYGSTVGDVLIFVSGDEKIISVPAGEEYEVRLVGTDSGEMQFEIMDADLVSGEVSAEKIFESVDLTAGKVMVSAVGSEETGVQEAKLYVVDNSGEPVYEILENGSEVPIQLPGDGKVNGFYLENGFVTKYLNGVIDTDYTGLGNYEGTWYYLTNGVQDNSFFGFTEFAGGKFLVANGTVATHINGLFQDPSDTAVWYFLSNGQAQTQYSGLALYDGAWFYLKDGILDTTFSGVVNYDGGKFLVGAGRIMSEVCGLCQDPITGTWYFFADGMVQDYTGEVEYGGSTFHITHGVLDA